MKKKPTIQDVANYCNVSTATVSRVINNKDKVSEDTKEKVLAAIKKLGFKVRKNDRLSNQKSRTILVCVTELKNPFFVPIIDGVQNLAHKHDYNILVLQTKQFYTDYQDYEMVLKSQYFAGMILLTSVTNFELEDITKKLKYRVPIVCCSEYVEGESVSYVCIDDEKALYTATRYAISLGRRKIAFINSNLKHNYAMRRDAGFRRAMADNNEEVNEEWMINLSSVSYNLAYSSALFLLSLEEKPDMIVCASDVYALGAINACRKNGLKVPEDIGVIGFDNIDLSLMSTPTITTMSQPSYQLGYQACELLIDEINNPHVSTKRLVLDSELIVRESTPM